MNNKPLISVLISAYNHEKYIERCLDSVLQDNYPNKELIIIDDGSKDNTKAIIKNWTDKNKDQIKTIFKSRENRGLSKTINELAEMTKGEYIVYLASDDYILNNSLTKRYEYLRHNPDKLAVFGDAMVVDDKDNVLHDSLLSGLHNMNKDNLFTDKDLRKELIKNWGIGGSIIMNHRYLFKVIGKMDENLSVEDRDYYLRMISRNILGFIDVPVSVYRRHPNNASVSENGVSDKILEDLAKTSLKNLKFFNWQEKLALLEEYVSNKHILLSRKKENNLYLNIKDINLLIALKILRLYKRVFFK